MQKYKKKIIPQNLKCLKSRFPQNLKYHKTRFPHNCDAIAHRFIRLFSQTKILLFSVTANDFTHQTHVNGIKSLSLHVKTIENVRIPMDLYLVFM